MKDTSPPLISCVMPTYNRRKFLPFAIRYFLRQSYTNKELIIVDDGTDIIEDLIPKEECIRYYRLDKKITLGEKLNLACSYAKGDIIANWDDDDWYDRNRLTYQIEALQVENVDVCGINHLLYFNLTNKNAYQYIYPAGQRPWLLGSSLCYTKSLWSNNPFAQINVGMDALFVWATSPSRVKALSDSKIAVHMIHEDNVSPKKTDGSWWSKYPLSGIQEILQDDWNSYKDGKISFQQAAIKYSPLSSGENHKTVQSLRNVFVCPVHENEDCVIDLVRNLHFHDQESRILLYNGGGNPNLLSAGFPYEKFGAEIYPDPLPITHGYLHTFGLKCMEFALQNYTFDTITIVDSDQLALRKGYSNFIQGFLNSRSNIGLLSNKPEQITSLNSNVWTAAQALKEYDLWKPLLKQFHEGENKFVHWSFWPSTIFTSDAVMDLVQLFKNNLVLQQIMSKTKIWATEEIVFPTLVKLLGYDIVLNPCCHDFVSYKKKFSMQDLKEAEKKSTAYWIHPIQRNYDDPLRMEKRQQSHHYLNPSPLLKDTQNADLPMLLPLLQTISKIEGWFSDKEADLLMATTIKACCSLPPPHHIVEIGSYQGKSTIVLGSVAKALFPEAKIFAIDPHEGVVGAMDQGLQKVPPTLEKFKKNIESAGLAEVVVLIKDYSYCIPWEDPISFLFIDGLHDYPNVARDFWKFSPFVVSDGYIAFHDYADYYPGVKALVHEILGNGQYEKVRLDDSLFVIQKL